MTDAREEELKKAVEDAMDNSLTALKNRKNEDPVLVYPSMIIARDMLVNARFNLLKYQVSELQERIAKLEAKHATE